MATTSELRIPISVAQKLAKANLLDYFVGLVGEVVIDAYTAGARDTVKGFDERLDIYREHYSPNEKATDLLKELDEFIKLYEYAPTE